MKYIKILFISILFSILLSCSDKNVITIYYTPSSTEAEDPPNNWEFYKMVEDELNIKLKLVSLPSSNSETDALILGLAEKNKLPDLFQLNSAVLMKLAATDKIVTTTKYFEQMPVRTKKFYDSKESRQAASFGKTPYALAHLGGFIRNEGLVIRKDWLDNLGLEVPKTLDEFYNVMYAFTYNDPDKNGKNDTYGFGAFFDPNAYEEGLGKRFAPFLGAFGVEGTYTLKNGMLSIHKPEFYDALQFIRKMYDNKIIDPNWPIYEKKDFRNAWKSGRFGIMREQFAALYRSDNYEPFDKEFPEGEWIVVDPPIGPNGDSSVGVNCPSYRTFAISKECEKNGKDKKIIKLLELMTTKWSNYICFGKENINYTVINNKITTEHAPFPYTDKNFTKYRQLQNFVVDYSPTSLDYLYPEYTSRNGKIINPIKKLEEMQTRRWTSPIMNMPAPSIDLRNFLRSSIQGFACGTMPLDKESWNRWIVEFNEKGGSEWETLINNYIKDNILK